MKYTKLIGFGLLGAALTAVGIYIYMSMSKDKEDKKGDPATVNYTKLLYKGIESPNEVIYLQNMLNSAGEEQLKIDGIFGDKTEEALMAYMGEKSATLAQVLQHTPITKQAPQDRTAV